MLLRLRNAKHWQTTVSAILGGLLVIAGVLWPEKVDPETQEVLKTGFNEVMIGLGALIPVIISIFGAGKKK